MTWLYPNRPKLHINPILLQYILDKIILTHGDPAGDNQHIPGQPLPNLFPEALLGIPCNAKDMRDTTCLAHLGCHGIAVAVRDLVLCKVLI